MCFKYSREFFMFFISTVYFGISIVVIYLCTWLMSLYKDGCFKHNNIVVINAEVPVIILLSVACIIFFVSILGCCGTCHDNKNCMMIFSMISTIAIIVVLCSGVLGLVYKILAHDNVENALFKAVASYRNTGYGSDKDMDFIQNKIKCCGVFEPSDWANSTYWDQTYNNGTETHLLPESCCVDKHIICKLSEGNFYKKGCLKPLLHDLKKHLTYSFGFNFGFAVLLALGILISCVQLGDSSSSHASTYKYAKINEGTYA